MERARRGAEAAAGGRLTWPGTLHQIRQPNLDIVEAGLKQVDDQGTRPTLGRASPALPDRLDTKCTSDALCPPGREASGLFLNPERGFPAASGGQLHWTARSLKVGARFWSPGKGFPHYRLMAAQRSGRTWSVKCSELSMSNRRSRLGPALMVVLSLIVIVQSAALAWFVLRSPDRAAILADLRARPVETVVELCLPVKA
jgi:hypothetical protein